MLTEWRYICPRLEPRTNNIQTNDSPTESATHHAHAASPLDPLDTPVSLDMVERAASIYANR
jgi:hypothetical protein